MYQHNALIKPGSKFYYPKAIGIKTGFTNAGGYTLIAAAEDEKRKLIAVLLGCEHLDERYKDAIALFDAAFNEKKIERTLFSKEFDTFNQTIKGGKTLLKAELKEDARIHFYESEKHHFSSKISWDENSLPIMQGQNVGKVTIFSREEPLLEVPLFAQHRVEPTLPYLLNSKWQSCKKMLRSYLGIVLALIGGALVTSCYFIFHRKV
jgi:D-alanyl-D-alanine carboxypeptidase (penicillin-binding protein 5/6)